MVREIANPAFDVPTTLAESGSRLYTVNPASESRPRRTNRFDIVKVR